MEFSFQINKVLDLNEDGIAVLHSSKLNPRGTYNSTPFYMQQFTPNTRLDPTQEKLSEILDKMGEASSKVYCTIFSINILIGPRAKVSHHQLREICHQ
jgi:hypothetical protein